MVNSYLLNKAVQIIMYRAAEHYCSHIEQHLITMYNMCGVVGGSKYRKYDFVPPLRPASAAPSELIRCGKSVSLFQDFILWGGVVIFHHRYEQILSYQRGPY